MKSTKKTLISTIVFLNSMIICAQDTLTLKNNVQRVGVVLEINPTEIRYKKTNDPQSPMYIINKADVTKIKYHNGTTEIFESVLINSHSVFRLNRSGKLFENNIRISENRMYGVLSAIKDPKINLHITNAKKYRTGQYVCFGMAIAVPASMVFIGSNSNDGIGVILAGAAAGAVCLGGSFYFKIKGNNQNREAIDLYNQNY